MEATLVLIPVCCTLLILACRTSRDTEHAPRHWAILYAAALIAVALVIICMHGGQPAIVQYLLCAFGAPSHGQCRALILERLM